MKILKFGLIALGVALGANTAVAQEKNAKTEKMSQPEKSPEEKAKMHTEKMSSELGLDEKQKNRIAAINLENAKRNEAIRKDASLSAEQKKSALEANRESHKSQIKQILTDEQWMEHEKREKAHMEHKKEHMDHKKEHMEHKHDHDHDHDHNHNHNHMEHKKATKVKMEKKQEKIKEEGDI